ncbi:hypothetical protein SYNPS1DRAFT_17399 [Syncephalis pseudoplumigaleata]|uniref:ubiquitinyl hydrolase 1 n=1 Tax=Syncephalis pseudoplumigaleata TaxID=1712513 RepID=A0A4P9YWR9_9FUNG|nr:hypothetical protein SYNPS1DRAFT_17399 [Syncephalis pseudoplumigaleata]|eukprot:RKP24305.1 hypothetical protein SYNPS1DRAFT_17399 [Syncephalis pseudoplumigaleata]
MRRAAEAICPPATGPAQLLRSVSPRASTGTEHGRAAGRARVGGATLPCPYACTLTRCIMDRFGKLFLAMLARSFEDQPQEHVRALVQQRFSGQYIYGTQCQRCRRLSTRQESFYEIELSLQEHDTLEDCIRGLLVAETLTGDNQYHCDNCHQKQDALRTLSIQALPPVLHFQLMRFVFNVHTLERSKVDTAIRFPATIDMRPFMDDPGGAPMPYDLTAVLLHDGPQASCGHFVAHVSDAA